MKINVFHAKQVFTYFILIVNNSALTELLKIILQMNVPFALLIV
jgi:hypothetical protein